ncbi:MAG TPA: hypothetical protein VEO00_08955, partial [Actinomycetota bacterium]|nr:hypothetical protein [Actinomycetota bacterium]
NVGLPIVECPGVSGDLRTGDLVRVDFGRGVVLDVAQGRSHEATPLPPFMQEILEFGGLMRWVRRSLDAGGRVEVEVGVSDQEPVQADWRLD